MNRLGFFFACFWNLLAHIGIAQVAIKDTILINPKIFTNSSFECYEASVENYYCAGQFMQIATYRDELVP